MFGAKRERQLENELFWQQQEMNHLQARLSDVAIRKENTEELFVQMTISKTELDETINLISEELAQLKGATEENAGQAVLLKQQVSRKTEQNEKLKGMQKELLKSAVEQKNSIAQLVEQNKHFTTPMKAITEIPSLVKDTKQELKEDLEKMSDAAEGMSVLALNAAIKAGGLGEEGKDFVQAAEDVRAASEQYAEEVSNVQQKIEAFCEKINDVEAQITRLNELLKENNISMNRLLQEEDKTIEEETPENFTEEQKNVENILDCLGQKENEIFEIQEKIGLRMEKILKDWEDHKKSSEELESIISGIDQTV